MEKSALAAYVDHTILKPDATPDQVRGLCREAAEYKFATVCVNPWMAALARAELAGTRVGLAVVVGFPLGATTTLSKALEARDAVANGACELDMVVNVGALKAGDASFVAADIAAVVKAAGSAGVKVIIETCLLADAEKRLACRLAEEAGAAFVKTSTGFSTGGATVADVRLMREAVGGRLKVKASGGIRDLAAALAMIEAGADRLGTSSGVAIVNACR